MKKREYNERIREKIEEIADGRIHHYEEVESIVLYVIWLTEQQVKKEISEQIKNFELYDRKRNKKNV